jgi:hypothetical protein
MGRSAIETRPGTVLLMRRGMTLRHDWGTRRGAQIFAVFDFVVTHGVELLLRMLLAGHVDALAVTTLELSAAVERTLDWAQARIATRPD